jgi:hypothetical protein
MAGNSSATAGSQNEYWSVVLSRLVASNRYTRRAPAVMESTESRTVVPNSCVPIAASSFSYEMPIFLGARQSSICRMFATLSPLR